MLRVYKYAIVIVFTLAVTALYHFMEIPLLDLDFMKRTRQALFVVRNHPDPDMDIFILNLGRLELDELQSKLDSLLLHHPKVVGVNLCHYGKDTRNLVDRYASIPNIYFADCRPKSRGALSEIINEGNVVTHFDCSRNDYFEFLLTDFKQRGNSQDMINYTPEQKLGPWKAELKDLQYYGFGNLEGKTILVGYLGEYLTDSLYDYKQCRITPLNTYYGQENILPDLYDTEVSANIIRTIRDQDYINEIGEVYRVLILLAFTLLNVFVLTFSQTRWLVVNLIIAALSFVVLTVAGSVMTVLLFADGYFLALDELSLVLLITTIFTVAINLRKQEQSVDVKKAPQIE